MKIINLLLSISIATALVSCGNTKTTKTSKVLPPMITTTDAVVAKKGEMTKEEIQKWPDMDILTDSVPGMSLAKAYNFLKGKKSKTVIVGIVDSGVDINHEDLNRIKWVNKNEIAGNNKDDDHNGYVDDVNGWNFLGDIGPEDLEYIRILKNPSISSEADVKRAQAKLDKEIKDAKANMQRYQMMLGGVTKAHETFSKYFKKEDYTKEDVEAIKTDDATLGQFVMMAKQMYGYGLSSLTQAIDELTKLVSKDTSLINGDNLKNDYRKVLGDNPEDITDTKYGDNNVLPKNDEEFHGTHVAGIVAADRTNNIGHNGVANNVKIMAVRAVPDGDEYDKDVALAIRYAVDNGAKVINMSFGKAFSPHSNWVYDAIKYAAKKDVVLVKAAGNDGENIDLQENLHYPTDSPVSGDVEIADNVIVVGAMTRHFDENLISTFSNYGKNRVDVFAPGSEIYSSVPHNKYLSIQGTSMASPAVAGVAALVRSYYPKLTAKQVKYIIMNSGIEFNKEVIIPHTKGKKGNFNNLSKSGKILNAYNAVIMAEKMSQ